MVRQIKYRMAGLVVLLGGLSLVGCVYDAGDCPEPTDREVVMSFRIATSEASATRATVVGEEDGTRAENWIDPANLRFLLLTEGGMFLRDLSLAGELTHTEDYGTYTVRTVSFRESYFDYAAVDGQVSFRIMVLANWPDNALKAIAGCRGLAEIEAAARREAGLYTLSADFSPALPSADAAGRGIPMYGLKGFTLSQRSLFESTELAPVDLTGADALHLLRALAKLEVVDRIEAKKEDGYPRIASVTLLGGHYGLNARLIPDAFRDGEQVAVPSLAEPRNTAPGDYRFAPRNYGELTPPVVQYPDGGGAVAVDYPNCYTAYLPETAIPQEKVLRIVVENSPGAQPPTATYTAAIPASADWGAYLLRNHIFRLEVTGAGTDLDMEYTYTICPWETVSGEIEFE